MKMTLRRIGKLLPLLVLVAALPFAGGGCKDAGDDGGNPTGPEEQYRPEIDPPRAGLTARPTNNTIPGGEFGVLGTYRDANKNTVAGVPVVIAAEPVIRISSGGSIVDAFTYATNPTWTDANGNYSVRVFVHDLTPTGSYTFVAVTGPGWKGAVSRVVFSIRVTSEGTETIALPDPPEGPTTVTVGSSATYWVDGTLRTSFGDEVKYHIYWGDSNVTNDVGSAQNWNASHSYASEGSYEIRVIAECATHAGVKSQPSDALKVTVQAAP